MLPVHSLRQWWKGTLILPPIHPMSYFPGVQKPLPYELPASGIVTNTGNGQPLFTATVKRGKLNGNWQSWFSNGVVCDSGRLVEITCRTGPGYSEIKKERLPGSGIIIGINFLRITNEMQHYHPKQNFISQLYIRRISDGRCIIWMPLIHFLAAFFLNQFPHFNNWQSRILVRVIPIIPYSCNVCMKVYIWFFRRTGKGFRYI